MRLVLLLLVVGLAGCGPENTVVVTNRSGADLPDVQIGTGEGTYSLGRIGDGETRRVSFTPDRDASLEICLDASDPLTCSQHGYVTSGLRQSHRFVVGADGIRYTSG